MSVTLAGPWAEVVDGLRGGGRVEEARQVMAEDHTKHLSVDEVWGGVIGIGREALADGFGAGRVRAS